MSFALTLSSPSLNWTTMDCCQWEGITCDVAGRVTHLHLSSKGLKLKGGSLPEDIYDATALEEIAIPANSFYGGISNRIVNLTNLTTLDFYFNHFSGMLPIDIGKLSKLKVLLLHSNNLEGSLPPSFLNCTNLMELNLGFNLLKGDISAFNFSRLGDNSITGNIPTEIGKLQLLHTLDLSANQLSGNIPDQISDLKKLGDVGSFGESFVWRNPTFNDES
ncbi:hypothetical protein J5N97_000482 [Dioscorea zingiberensis]|uniref:Leucine-rich repeat-containing N-terminal plant-type domain-containing protein n=1 Tax=Dioscorea zingiberensis TaxID=325984 RepID=A0A9D5BS92_9LILI|nr:hypothetical protein J5N97_000482 [Dioscorea zingiberensis]